MCQVCGHQQVTYTANEPTLAWPEFALAAAGPLAPSAIRPRRAAYLRERQLLAPGYSIAAVAGGYALRSSTGQQVVTPSLIAALQWLSQRGALTRAAAVNIPDHDWAHFGVTLALSRLAESAPALTLDCDVYADGRVQVRQPQPNQTSPDSAPLCLTFSFERGTAAAYFGVIDKTQTGATPELSMTPAAVMA